MKRKIIILSLLILILVSTNTFAFSTSTEINILCINAIYNGNGTMEDPYLIYNEQDLRKIGNDADWTLDKSYKLMVDIVLEKPEEGKSNWLPIGTRENPFKGNFDGNNNTIKNMTIVGYSSDYTGFFGRVVNRNGVIENLGLLDIEMKGHSSSGGLAGIVGIDIIRNCFVTGNIQVQNEKITVGGLVGLFDGNIEGCYSNVDIYVKGTGNSVGGLAGFLSQGKITNSYSTGYIYGNQAGGIAGYTLEETTIENCYSLSTIEPYNGNVMQYINSIIGGIIGLSGKTTIKNCYFAGSLIINYGTASGGIIGRARDKTSVQSSLVLSDNIVDEKISSNQISSIGYLAYLDDQIKFVVSDNNYILKDIYLNLPARIEKNEYLSNIDDFNIELVSKRKLTEKYFYESIGWSFSGDDVVWQLTRGYMLPKLVGVGGQENLVTPKHLL